MRFSIHLIRKVRAYGKLITNHTNSPNKKNEGENGRSADNSFILERRSGLAIRRRRDERRRAGVDGRA